MVDGCWCWVGVGVGICGLVGVRLGLGFGCVWLMGVGVEPRLGLALVGCWV